MKAFKICAYSKGVIVYMSDIQADSIEYIGGNEINVDGEIIILTNPMLVSAGKFIDNVVVTDEHI